MAQRFFDSWPGGCRETIDSLRGNDTNFNGLVDRYGNPNSTWVNGMTWGITLAACNQYCGDVSKNFIWNDFSNSLTSWLLPWLALTAQLPFEASTSWGNTMSLFLAIGSPATITYSLALTILNRAWVRRKFDGLRKQQRRVAAASESIRKRMPAVLYLLQEAQQVPMRASDEDGWLSSLIMLEENEAWWSRVKKDLANSRRGYTFSLFAQILFAFFSYLFTIISSFVGALGNESVALNLAGGSMWIWMIPIILGWIMTGVQARANSVEEALDDIHPRASRVYADKLSDGEPDVRQSFSQSGIQSRSGLNPRPAHQRQQYSNIPKASAHLATDSDSLGNVSPSRPENPNQLEYRGHVSHANRLRLKSPKWLGFSLQGDEAREGPIFNYARVLTWRRFANTITVGFSSALDRVESETGVVGQGQRSPHSVWPFHTSVIGRRGMLTDFAKYSHLDRPLDAYPKWSEISSSVWHDIFLACAIALFIQWGTTGPAIMIAYLTPATGLGCRSGGYLIYGVAATVAWALLLISSFLSHAAMLQHQDRYIRSLKKAPRRGPEDCPEEGMENFALLDDTEASDQLLEYSTHSRPLRQSVLAGLTVTTRVLGKLVAALNAVWIITSAIFEYTGFYENCWCEAVALGLGSRAWALIFVANSDLVPVVRSYWIEGVFFSFAVCAVSTLFFYLGSGNGVESTPDD